MPRKPTQDWGRVNWSKTNAQIRDETGLSVVSIMRERRKAKARLPQRTTWPLQDHLVGIDTMLDNAGVPAWRNGQRLPTSERLRLALGQLKQYQHSAKDQPLFIT